MYHILFCWLDMVWLVVVNENGDIFGVVLVDIYSVVRTRLEKTKGWTHRLKVVAYPKRHDADPSIPPLYFLPASSFSDQSNFEHFLESSQRHLLALFGCQWAVPSASKEEMVVLGCMRSDEGWDTENSWWSSWQSLAVWTKRMVIEGLIMRSKEGGSGVKSMLYCDWFRQHVHVFTVLHKRRRMLFT